MAVTVEAERVRANRSHLPELATEAASRLVVDNADELEFGTDEIRWLLGIRKSPPRVKLSMTDGTRSALRRQARAILALLGVPVS